MIGMMYLVLTALLALNVSAEVLNAFVLIDNSLVKSAENFQNKNGDVYAKIEALLKEKPAVKPTKDKMDEVKIEAQKIFDRVQELKLLVVQTADGPEGDPRSIQNKADNNIPGQIMILEGRGAELKKEIEAFREKLLSYMKDTVKNKGTANGIKNSLNTSDIVGNTGDMVPWATANFDHLPLAGVVTLMSKIQSDIRNAESEILAYLLSQVDAGTFKFNKLEAIVKTNSNYVLVGNKYEAEVFIAASDSTEIPNIQVGGRKLTIKNGKGVYSGSTGSVGIKKWGGVIKIKSPATGDTLEYKFDSEYQVAEAGLVVSPTKMNVFYIGVANPVAISVSGVPDDKVSASISSGSIVKTGKEYVVKVKKTGKVYIDAIADFGNGSKKNMGRKEFRVKRVPDPVAVIGNNPKNRQGGVMAKNMLLAQSGVKADLPNFDFNLKFRVTGFSVSATIKGYEEDASSRGAGFTSQQKQIIRKVTSGRKVYIENIKAAGPDGSIRTLGTIAFKLR